MRFRTPSAPHLFSLLTLIKTNGLFFLAFFTGREPSLNPLKLSVEPQTGKGAELSMKASHAKMCMHTK